MTSGSVESMRTQLAAICDRLLPAGVLASAQRDEFLSQVEQTLTQAKLESLAEFAAGAGHEINNPVATISGRAQLLLGSEVDPERRHALEIIGGQALRIRDMIGDTMLFARPPAPRHEAVDLAEIARLAVASQGVLQTQQKAKVTIDIADQTTVWGDRTQLLVLLSSLVRNSLEAADRPGVNVRLSVRLEQKADALWNVITVSDDGPGITEAEREHLFDPFFSGRQAGRGLGFGLSKCWRIVKLHGGEIFARQANDRGAVLEVWWPPRAE